MLDELVINRKRVGQLKPAAEVGVILELSPYFVFEVNGQRYSSEFFTVYLPAIDRIKQHDVISTDDHTEALVEIGDLEIDPWNYARAFKLGDLIDVTDRGQSFIVHGRLVKIS